MLGSASNKGLELTASSVRSCLAPASSSSSCLALGCAGINRHGVKECQSPPGQVSRTTRAPSPALVPGTGSVKRGQGNGQAGYGAPTSSGSPGADALRTRGRPPRIRRYGEAETDLAGSETPCMRGNTVDGTREALPLPWPSATRPARRTREAHGREAQREGVGQLQSPDAATAPRQGRRTGPNGGGRGGKGAGHGARRWSTTGSGRSAGVPGHGRVTASVRPHRAV